MNKEQYDFLKRQNEEASRKNDYSRMIMMGSELQKLMKEYEMENCPHPEISTDGGGDYCRSCGKRWER